MVLLPSAVNVVLKLVLVVFCFAAPLTDQSYVTLTGGLSILAMKVYSLFGSPSRAAGSIVRPPYMTLMYLKSIEPLAKRGIVVDF